METKSNMLSAAAFVALLACVFTPGAAKETSRRGQFESRRALRSYGGDYNGYNNYDYHDYSYKNDYDQYYDYKPKHMEHDYGYYDKHEICYDYYWYYYPESSTYYRCEYNEGKWGYCYEGTWYYDCEWGCHYASYDY